MASNPRKHTLSKDRDISPPPKRKATGTVTSKAVANFFKPASQKEPEKVQFKILHESLLVAKYEPAPSDLPSRPLKVAAFDFDDTVIATKSGKVFAKGEDDWRWWHANVPARLKQLHAEGYAVVVISNQGGISLRTDSKTAKGDMKSLSNFKGKVANVLKTLDLPVTVYAATEKDLYRKPRTGMWEQMLRDSGSTEDGSIAKDECIFVGDAAGREGDKAKGVRKDHSCSDRDFAANAGIPFKTPEEFFLDEEPVAFQRTLNPKEYRTGAGLAEASSVFEKKNDLDIVLFCGSPASGKSTFYWQHLQPLGYARVNQDLLKTRDKCVKVGTGILEEEHQSIVVDNTNADVETRAVWIALARKLNVPIRLVLFNTSAKLCEHNDTVRALSSESTNPEKRTMLPKMAFTGFTNRYKEPSLNEGFQDITQVDFVLRGTEAEKAIWSRYWIS